MSSPATVGQRIQHHRESAGLSRAELGDQLGMQRTLVYRWETGATYPAVKTLVRMADLFRTSVDDLLCREVS